MKEIWKPTVYCADYEISNLGRLRSLKRSRTLYMSPKYTHDGYEFYILSKDGVPKTFRTNRLVAEAFVPNPLNKPTVNHIDGNKLNNRFDNLEWETLSEQMKHAYATGLKKPVHPYVLTEEERDFIKKNYKAHDPVYGMQALAKRFNVCGSTIRKYAK